jgi:hypothetical protein
MYKNIPTQLTADIINVYTQNRCPSRIIINPITKKIENKILTSIKIILKEITTNTKLSYISS